MKAFVRGLSLSLLLVMMACDADSLIAGPVASCSEAGAQCQLPEGPLGVCERTPCRDSESPRCYACVSQH